MENSEFCTENGSYRDVVEEIVKKYPCNYSRMLKSRAYSGELNWINCKTSWLSVKWEDASFKTRVYLALSGEKHLPRCKACGHEMKVNVISIKAGFPGFCSRKCANSDPDVIAKKEKTCLKLYGTKNASSSPEIKARRKATVRKRYGVDNVAKLESSTARSKATRLVTYGDENWNNSEKARTTCLERYGVEYSTQSEPMKERSRATCLERYGVENAGYTPEAAEKIRATNLERRGVEFPMQDEGVRQKAVETFLAKYGVETPFIQPHVLKANGERVKRVSYDNFIANNEYDEPLFTIEEYIARADDRLELPFRCRKCRKEFSARHKAGRHERCPECFPRPDSGTSNEEREMAALIASYAPDTIENVRDVIPPLELDVYVPSRKLAFEFDGLYWHSSLFKDDTYHLAKTEACAAKGIRLVHVFEDEWREKRGVVTAMIRDILCCPSETVMIDDCETVEIRQEESDVFFNLFNIGGAVQADVSIGLRYDGRFVAMMSFSEKQDREWEIVRMCKSPDIRIDGWISKILQQFNWSYEPKNITVAVDRRWSDGSELIKSGFSKIGSIRPIEWWFRNGTLDRQLVEMKSDGYSSIFDCGKLVFRKEEIR